MTSLTYFTLSLGGYVFAIAIKAFSSHLESVAPKQYPDPFTLSFQFVTANRPNWNVEIHVELIKYGKSEYSYTTGLITGTSKTHSLIWFNDG